MSKRLIIVGAVAAGASAAAKARRTSEDIEIVMFEKGSYMSFANCGLPYYMGGEIQKRDSLFVADPVTAQALFCPMAHGNRGVATHNPVARVNKSLDCFLRNLNLHETS